MTDTPGPGDGGHWWGADRGPRADCPSWCTSPVTDWAPHDPEPTPSGTLLRVHIRELNEPTLELPVHACVEATEETDAAGDRTLSPPAVVLYGSDGQVDGLDPAQLRRLAALLLDAADECERLR